jgi:hypothetical protein
VKKPRPISVNLKSITIQWDRILELQDEMHPGWRNGKPRTLYTTGLTSEVGEICDVVTHMDGGGSQVLDPKRWNNLKLLNGIMDTIVMLVLVAEKSDLTAADLDKEWHIVESELIDRIQQRKLNGI